MKKINKILYIIWEGPDEVGKTTTRKLVEKTRQGRDIMIDRFIGSNLIYGKLFKRYSERELKEIKIDENLFNRIFNPILIYLYAPVKTIAERIKKDKHEKINISLLKKTLKEYDEYYNKSEIVDKIKIDTSKHNQEEVVQIINTFLFLIS
ncbi:MAG: hypothetical protein WC438_05545 [Candidatus Pacearchaeota archaeon]